MGATSNQRKDARDSWTDLVGAREGEGERDGHHPGG